MNSPRLRVKGIFQSAHPIATLLPLALCLLVLHPPEAGAQALGSREIGMGQATVALQDSRWALFGNPALLPADRTSLSFFGMRYYGLSELTDMAAAISAPSGSGVWAAGIHRYGFDLYREQQFRAGWKHRSGALHYGLALAAHHVSIGGGYGSSTAFGIDGGLAAELGGGVMLGMRATNLNRPGYRTEEGEREMLRREVGIGLSARLGSGTLLTAEAVKDVRFPLTFRSGLEIRLLPGFQFHAGATAQPQTLSGGISLEGPHWGAGLAVQRHADPLLGYSPGIDFNLLF